MKTNFFYNEYGYKIRIGYCIFRYINNKLYGLANDFAVMKFHDQVCNVWNDPPLHYFQPSLGDFLIKTTRLYEDLYIIKYTGSKSNYYFKQINILNKNI
jgi:hypothetical protein